MSIFDVFRRKPKDSSESDGPRIKFGFRGEDIEYSLPSKDLDLTFTWIDGPRVYTESINKWRDGSALTEDEKRKVFGDVVHFVARESKKPIIVVNSDDPLKGLWEQLCALHQSVIKSIEYTSDEEQYQFERGMWLGFIKAGKGVVLDGVEVRSEKDLDEAMQRRRRNRAV